MSDHFSSSQLLFKIRSMFMIIFCILLASELVAYQNLLFGTCQLVRRGEMGIEVRYLTSRGYDWFNVHSDGFGMKEGLAVCSTLNQSSSLVTHSERVSDFRRRLVRIVCNSGNTNILHCVIIRPSFGIRYVGDVVCLNDVGLSTTQTQTFIPTTQTSTSTAPTSTPTTQTSNPTTQTSNPTTQTSIPTPQTSIPTTQTAKPTTQTSIPTTQTSIPTTQTSNPTTQTSNPTTQTSNPTTQTAKPTTQTSIPTTQTSIPTTQTSNPTTQTAKPTTQTSIPTTQTSNPTTQTSNPTTQTSNPTTQTSNPTTQTSNPTTQTSNPTTQTSNPTTQTSNPTTQKPNPTTQTSSPLIEMSNPTNRASTPNSKLSTNDGPNFLLIISCLSATTIVSVLITAGVIAFVCTKRKHSQKKKIIMESIYLQSSGSFETNKTNPEQIYNIPHSTLYAHSHPNPGRSLPDISEGIQCYNVTYGYNGRNLAPQV